MASTYVIGITGGSGSGKTSFVKALKQRLGDSATFFSQDDYYLPLDMVPLDASGVHNFDLPEAIDSTEMSADIARVLAGETVIKTEYTFETSYREAEAQERDVKRIGKTLHLRPARILVIEGLFVFHEEVLTEHMDLKIFIDAHDVAKLSRRIIRDRKERDLPLEDVLFRYEAHVLPAYEKYIQPTRNSADIVINNNLNFESGLEVLLGYLANLADHQEVK